MLHLKELISKGLKGQEIYHKRIQGQTLRAVTAKSN